MNKKMNIIKIILILLLSSLLLYSTCNKINKWMENNKIQYDKIQHQKYINKIKLSNKNQAKDAMKVPITSSMINVHGNELDKHYVQQAFNFWDHELNYPLFNYWHVKIYFNTKNINTYNFYAEEYDYGKTKLNNDDNYASAYSDKDNIVIYINQKDAEKDGVSVSRVIAHELGHALGLNHTNKGLMESADPYGNWNISKSDIYRIKHGNWDNILTVDQQYQMNK